MNDHVATLADLVRRPSVNPMGRDVSGPEYLEGRVGDYLAARFEAAGIPWARQRVAPGRDNILAVVEPTEAGGPTILWDAHQDTVPVEGMSIEPFRPSVQQGRLYGRGACDVKGGMAAMLVAIDRLGRLPRRRSRVIFAASVNEEFGFSGARAVARLWEKAADDLAESDRPAAMLLGGRPDAAVVAEPTGLDIVTEHKGAIRWRVRVLGRACHSAFPEEGVNAIYPTARVIAAIESLAGELLRRDATHPCGPPTLSIGTIHGGVGVNLVPDAVVLEIDRRIVPGESPVAARDEVIERITAAMLPADLVEHEEPFLESGGLAVAGDSPAGMIEAAAGTLGLGPRRLAARYGTNAGIYAAAGVPSVVFGPGSIAQAHTADEWIDLDELATAVSILERTVG